MSDIPKAIAESEFELFGVKLRCYVLDDGRRVINSEDVERLFEEGLAPDEPEDIEQLVRWLRSAGE